MLCQSLLILGLKGQGSGLGLGLRHRSHICEIDAATKFIFSAQMHYGWLLPADQKLCWNAVGVTEYSI